MADDLSAPLGQNRIEKPPSALPLLAPMVVAGVLGLGVAVLAGWAMFADDPLGGEPMTVVTADIGAETGKKPDEAPSTINPTPNGIPVGGAQQATAGPPPGSKTITIIDGTSGKRQEIVVPGSADGKTPDGKTAEGKLTALDERVSEPSRHGLLPKVAQDGARPSEVFARPVKPIPGKPNAPRIAIVVGGLGIGANVTNDAIRKLPGRGDARIRGLRRRSRAPGRAVRAPAAMKCCCRSRWSRSIIPTTIPARRPC